MKDHGLGREQLFSLKRVTLEKRIKLFFKETKDSNSAIEMLVALQIRDELCEDDFSFMLADVAKYIFSSYTIECDFAQVLHLFHGIF